MILPYLWKTTRIVLITTFSILFLRTLIIDINRVNGVSMEPNFFDQQTFYTNKFLLLFSLPKRGQIVSCKSPVDGTLMIKRIIGLPGEQVHIKNNRIYITDTQGNSKELNEPYLSESTITQPWDGGATIFPKLGPDEYFVLGDNRRESLDSRIFGAISRKHILGAVITSL